MARKFVAKQPKNQRPMINNVHTAAIKKKMSYAFLPFVVGAIVLVFSMGQGVESNTTKLVMMIAGLVLFLIGLLVIVKYAKELNDYAKVYWEEYDKKHPGKQPKAEAPREKVTWAQAVNEYKEEAKATAVEASRQMAEKIAKAEAQRMAEEAKKAKAEQNS